MDRFWSRYAEVEAMQFVESHDGSLPLAGFCGGALRRIGEDALLAVRTRQGDRVIGVGNWVVRARDGSFYPVEDTVFRELYEPHEA